MFISATLFSIYLYHVILFSSYFHRQKLLLLKSAELKIHAWTEKHPWDEKL